MFFHKSLQSTTSHLQKASRDSTRWTVSARHGQAILGVVFFGLLLVGASIAEGNHIEDATPRSSLASMAAAGITEVARRQQQSKASDDESIIDTPNGSYSRYSSDMQREESVTDQQRTCRDKAALNGHQICPRLEFSDEAISGTKRHRHGLDAMLHAAKTGRLKVLYFHSLSRLSRESVITLPLLKELVYNYGVRVISVTEGIDSDVNGWELIAHIMSIVHEQYVKDLAENVLRGQEGAVLAGLSVGDYCFGYTTQPVPDGVQGSCTRQSKPRMVYTIDPETAAWVERIFRWFVHERRSIRWIARELNRLRAPKDHRSTTPNWRHQYVSRLLGNRKYIGVWPWGQKRNVRDPLTGKIRQVDRPSSECEKWERHLPHLRTIDDVTFERAQHLLAENRAKTAKHRRKNGQLNGGSKAENPRHLLSGIISCGECGRSFNVGGANGKYMFCPGYHQGDCSCKTQLRLDRAEQMILDAIGRYIVSNDAWRKLVLQEAINAFERYEATVPSELVAAQRSLQDVEQKIENLLNQIENGRGGPELDERLVARRAEKQKLQGQVERLRRAEQGRPPKPTETWVDEQLCNLVEVLNGSTPAATHALRELVGGNVVVTEIRRPNHKRHYLQGRFTVAVRAVTKPLVGAVDVCGMQTVPTTDDCATEIIIDFREPAKIETTSELAKNLYDAGLMNAQIAEQLECSRSRVTALLKHWFESRNLVMPDGRSRRASLRQKHVEPPLYQQIADGVMELVDRHYLLQDVAEAMNVDRNTVTAAIRWWYESHDLPVPDGRTRRKELDEKTSAARKAAGARKPEDRQAL